MRAGRNASQNRKMHIDPKLRVPHPTVAKRQKQKRKPSRRLAKPVELALYVLLATGLILFEPFGTAWLARRWVLVVHVIAGLLFVPALLLPFWARHRGFLKLSHRPFMVFSGRVIELMLAAMILSGGWLFFVGWNGTADGEIAHWTHLLVAIPLVALVLAHAWRTSVFRALLTAALLATAFIGLNHPASGAEPRPSAIESKSLWLEAGGKTLLAANFDGGSVSRIDRASGRRLAETVLGGNLTALAIDAKDGLIAVTDYEKDRLFFLKLGDLAQTAMIALPGRPAGIVYDPRNHLFWVAATEGNRLYAVRPDGRIARKIETARSPRGLALLADGRLLVSHAMIGAVSIYDTTAKPLKRLRLITLAVEQSPDQTISQGLPRRLDRIAVSPDGKQAWLPHVLWNFDHPFQFQSTVFPAISVIDLTPGDEHEAVSRRKQLFKQINIIEDGNQTRIVSNPADATFSDNGKKVFVTMAGSEDLAVFDLSRALPISSKSKKAKTTGGAKAVEIYRHLPGQNPRGLIVTGTDIYVQNAQGLDLSKLTTGGEGAFARIKVIAPHFATLVAKDPLAPDVRRGERLFNLANTKAFADAPMTGDNWMSCSSCHVDGFNFTNKALFEATPVDKFHSAFTGHGTIEHLVAGDFVSDYIRIIKNTQGGMGADTRFATPVTDPLAPSPAIDKMMRDLHAYVVTPNNLPLFGTWLRGENGGASVDPKAWTNSALCASCHSDIFEQWANSNHHFSGQSDPYYVVLEDLAAQTEGEPFRAWCMGCHAPQALLSGETKTSDKPSRMFDRNGSGAIADLMQYAHSIDEGTGCIFCHTVDSIEDAGGLAGANASLTVAPGARPLYPGETSDNALLRGFAERLIRAQPQEHKTSLMHNIKDNPKLCASCHEEFAPGTGAYIVDTYQEWYNSSFNAPNDPAKNRTCADCHMHADTTRLGEPIPGRATDGGPLKKDVRTHQFVGAQYHLVGLRDPNMRAQSIALLRTAATLEARREGPDTLVVRVNNTGTGHRLPTGVSDFRQLWLEVTVTDAAGKIVLSSGKRDAAGNLDPHARLFQKAFDDKASHAVGLEFWRYAVMHEDTRIPADGYRDESFTLPADTRFPVRVDVRLMFRTFPQWITDLVRERFPHMPPPAAVDIADLSQTLGQP